MQAFTNKRLHFFLLIVLATFFTQSVYGIGAENIVVIAPGTEYEPITYGSGTLVNYEEPTHGTLVPVPRGFHYYPDESFWAVGHDVVLMDVTPHRSGITSNYRVVFSAGELSLENNSVYSTTSITGVISQPWVVSNTDIINGLFADDAYEMPVETEDPAPMMTILDDNAAGHQQTSEHVVNVSVDDIDFNRWQLTPGNQLPFYRIKQGNLTIIELIAHFDFAHNVWQVKPYYANGSTVNYTDVNPGFYQTKLVRWGGIGGSGADFFINGQLIGTVTGLPTLATGPVTYELAVDQTEEHNGLTMRFEDPTLVTGTHLIEPYTRLAHDAFNSGFTGVGSVSPTWDVVEGQNYMSFSPQTLAGTGNQLDIDLGAVPHWEHVYLRQNFLSDPLTNYKARFWMDPTTLDIPEGGSVRIIYGCRDSAASWCVDFRLNLTKVNGELTLNLHTWDDIGGSQVISTVITQEPHMIDLQYQAGAAPGLATGRAELWVDGTSVGASVNLDNANMTLEDVRIGTNYTAGAITGILSLDEIQTWTR